MTTPWDPWLRTYVDFSSAIEQGNLDEIARYVTEDFVAIINGKTFDLAAFRNEIVRQRLAFSDYGKYVDLHEAGPENGMLMVHYDAYVTFDGPLYNMAGQWADPTGERLKITSTDWYCFDPSNKITRIQVTAFPGAI